MPESPFTSMGEIIIGAVATFGFAVILMERSSKVHSAIAGKRALFLDILLVLCGVEIFFDGLHDLYGTDLTLFIATVLRSAIGVGAFAMVITFPTSKEVRDKSP